MLRNITCPFSTCTTKSKHKNFNFRGLIAHFARGHEQDHHPNPDAEGQFKNTIQCPKCVSRGDKTGALINGIWNWKRHFDLVHEEQKQTVYQCFICLDFIRTARGLKSHYHHVHEQRERCFANPFPCPECVRLGQTDPPGVIGRKAWQDHVEQYHNGGAKEVEFGGAMQSPTVDGHYCCLICLNYYNTRDGLGKHMAKDHTAFFEMPFKCPECVRQGNADTDLFLKKRNWLDHVRKRHPAHPSASCLDSALLDGLPTPPVTPKDDMEMASVETGLYRQMCGSSDASPSSCDTTSGGLATPDAVDDAVIDHLDHRESSQISKPEAARNKRKRG